MDVVTIEKILVRNLLIYIYLHCVRRLSWSATYVATLAYIPIIYNTWYIFVQNSIHIINLIETKGVSTHSFNLHNIDNTVIFSFKSWRKKVTYRKYWHGCSLCSKYVQYTLFSRMPALAKGQLISKWLFGVFKFSKKQWNFFQDFCLT